MMPFGVIGRLRRGKGCLLERACFWVLAVLGTRVGILFAGSVIQDALAKCWFLFSVHSLLKQHLLKIATMFEQNNCWISIYKCIRRNKVVYLHLLCNHCLKLSLNLSFPDSDMHVLPWWWQGVFLLLQWWECSELEPQEWDQARQDFLPSRWASESYHYFI